MSASSASSSSTSTPSSPVSTSTPSWAVLLIHVNIALYAFYWWMCQPVMPYLSKELGADPVVFGYLQSFNQLVMLLGAPVIGKVIDKQGPKYGLLISHLMGGLGYFLLYCSTSVPLLFLSQLPGVFMAAMHSSQAYITLISSEQDRAKKLGRLSLSYGIGFMLGPIVGGGLSKMISYAQIAFIAAIGSILLNVVLLILLPSVHSQTTDQETTTAAHSSQEQQEMNNTTSSSNANKENKLPVSKYAEFTRLLHIPSIRSLLLLKFFLSLPLSTYRSSFSLIAQNEFSLDAQQLGFVLSFVGGATIIVNSFVIGELIKRFPENKIINGSILACIISFAALSIISSVPHHSDTETAALTLHPQTSFWMILLFMSPMTLGGATGATLLTSLLTRQASLSDAGSILGLDMAIGTASRVIAPTLGGYVMQMGSHYVSVLCLILCVGGWILSVTSNSWHGSQATASASTEKATSANVEMTTSNTTKLQQRNRNTTNTTQSSNDVHLTHDEKLKTKYA